MYIIDGERVQFLIKKRKLERKAIDSNCKAEFSSMYDLRPQLVGITEVLLRLLNVVKMDDEFEDEMKYIYQAFVKGKQPCTQIINTK